MNTDTPETDANAECDQEDGSPFAPVREWVHADFARKLERERDRLDDQLDQTILRLGETQERMIDAERQRDRLAEALKLVAEGSLCCACRGSAELVSIAEVALATLNQPKL